MSEITPSLAAALEKAHVIQDVKLKLPVLTKIGRILMTDNRPNDDVNVDKTRYQFFRQCSLLILGLGFQSLPSHNPQRSSFTAMLEKGARQLSPKPFPEFCSLFHVLLWLVESHWTHPTLARVLTGMDVDQAAVNTWPEATIPELLKLRIEILASADCERYALNLCRWCSKLPALSTEVSVYTVYFRLLHKFNRMDEFTKLCKGMRCCLGLQVIEASEKFTHVLVLVQTFLSVDWLKPSTYCCTKKLLRHWMQIEWQVAPQSTQFLTSVACLAKRAVNSWQAVSLIETMYSLVDRQLLFHPFYMRTLLAVLRTDHAELVKSMDDAARQEQTTARLVYCCLVLATTASTWCARIRRAAMLTAFSLSRRLDAYYAVKEVYSGDSSDVDDVSQCVGERLVTEVLSALSEMRESYLRPELDWPTLQAMCLYRLYGNISRQDTQAPHGNALDDGSVVSKLTSGQQSKQGLLLGLLMRPRPNASGCHPTVTDDDDCSSETAAEVKQEHVHGAAVCPGALTLTGSERAGAGVMVTHTSAVEDTDGGRKSEMPMKDAKAVKISIVDITRTQETEADSVQSATPTDVSNPVSKHDVQKGGGDYQASYVAYVGQTNILAPPVTGPMASWQVHVPESFHWRRRKGSISGATRQWAMHYKCKKGRVCKTFLCQHHRKLNRPYLVARQRSPDRPHQVAHQLKADHPRQVAQQIKTDHPRQVAHRIKADHPRQVAQQVNVDHPHQVAQQLKINGSHQVAQQHKANHPHQVVEQIEVDLPHQVAQQLKDDHPHQVAQQLDIYRSHQVAQQLKDNDPHQMATQQVKIDRPYKIVQHLKTNHPHQGAKLTEVDRLRQVEQQLKVEPNVARIVVTRSRHQIRQHIGRHVQFPHQMALEEEMKVVRVASMRRMCGLCSTVCASHLLVVKHLWETHKVRLLRLDSYKKAATCDLCGHIYVQRKCMLKHMSDHEMVLGGLFPSPEEEEEEDGPSSRDARLERAFVTNMHQLVLDVPV